MATRQKVGFPFADEGGQNGSGFGNQLMRALRTAALFSEPPEHRLRRLSVEQRQYESGERIRQNDERLDLSRRDAEERRMERQRRAEREDLDLELALNKAGRRLSPDEAEGLKSGELLGVDLGEGVNMGPQGGTTVEHGGDSFFVPGGEAQRILDLERKLDEEARLQRARTIAINAGALPGAMGQVLEGQDEVRIPPSSLGTILSAAQRAEGGGRSTMDKVTFTGADDVTERVYIDPETGETKRVPLGKSRGPRVSPSEARMQSQQQYKQRVQQEASRIFLEAGGDANKALASIAQQAEFAEDEFLSENAVEIANTIRLLARKDDNALGLDPEIAAQLGLDTETSGAAQAERPRLGGAPSRADRKERAKEFLKQF